MRKKKVFLILLSILGVLVFMLILKLALFNSKTSLNKNIYKFLLSRPNRVETYEAAIKLNDGNSKNSCVYFASEVLRRNKLEVPKSVKNTKELTKFLTKKGWKKIRDYKKLSKGDIVFTTDAKGDKYGVPTHTYIFMAWVNSNYDYAYICDNQAKDYANNIYHTRNIKGRAVVNGEEKDAFSFFMRP